MFVLKSLGKFILGNYEQRELLSIPSGKLYSTTKQSVSPKKGKAKEYELVDEDSSLTLVRASEEKDNIYEYELAVSDLTFNIDKNLDFSKSREDDQVSFCWKDPRLDVWYKFVIGKETSTTTIEMFHVTLAQCLFEVINKRSHTTARDDEVEALLKTTTKGKKADGGEGETVFVSQEAMFYVFDAPSNTFVPHKVNPVKASMVKCKKEFRLLIKSKVDDTISHEQSLDPDATQHTDRTTNSFIWCHLNEQGFIWTYSLKFTDTVNLLGLANAYGLAVYELLNQERMSKSLSEADAKYVLNPFLDDVVMAEPEEDEFASSSEEEGGREGELDTTPSPTIKMPGDKDANSQLVVGYKHDRSFVSRGSALGVFKHTADDQLVLHANLDKVQTLKGKKSFTPSKMMLYDQDTSMLLQNPNDLNRIYRMDLERGQVVDEWTVHEEAPVTSILPDTKYAQMTSNPTLIGLNQRSIFRIDPRLPGQKRVDSEMKSYVTKNEFSCGTTTGSGELAVASAKGEIRLFNKIDKRAKTLLPMFGDPIIGIDTTESGRYIVATCKTYLLFISTEIPGTDSLGFTKPMGQDKPIPLRLQLKPEHVAHMACPIAFTPARFSTGQAEERAIITSTGPFVITWNLRRVKQGKVHDYQIKRYSDTVVADGFRYGADRSIVVTLPHHVTMVSKSSLQAATPKSLRTSRNVVDSPF